MPRTKITTEQFDFLLSKLEDSEAASIVLAGVCSVQPDPKYVEIELSREEFSQVVFALAIALTEVGIDKDGEPNETCYHIEKIADALRDGKIQIKAVNQQGQQALKYSLSGPGARAVLIETGKSTKLFTHLCVEAFDASGKVRIVRPKTGGTKVHYLFDAGGNYVGTF